MAKDNDKSRVVAALNYLRTHKQFFEFDNRERVIKVGISDVANVDEFAKHIGSLRDLQELTFYGTGLTDRGLSHLANLVRLRELWIGGPGITSAGLAHLGAMSHLEKLYIDVARDLDMAAFACIARVASLRELSLSGGGFCDADLEPLAALANLQELSLSDNEKIHGTFCQHFSAPPRLRHLSIGEGTIRGEVTDEGLASIAELSSLNKLNVTGPFTNAGLRCLVALQELTTLAVDSEHVTADGVAVVAQLPKLEWLHLDTPRLTDDVIAALLTCSALEEMGFTRSAVSDAGLQRLRDGLPKCGVGDRQRDPYEFGPWLETKDTKLRFGKRTQFLKLLAKASDWNLVTVTFDKIGARYDHWVDASEYSPEEGVIMLVWHSSGIIDHGGFEYLFAGEFPGDPDFKITAEAYRTAGLLRGYEAFQEAFALFPGGTVPHDRAERSQLFHAANRSARDRLKRKLWQDGLDGSREKKLAQFIRAHAAQLGDLDSAP